MGNLPTCHETNRDLGYGLHVLPLQSLTRTTQNSERGSDERQWPSRSTGKPRGSPTISELRKIGEIRCPYPHQHQLAPSQNCAPSRRGRRCWSHTTTCLGKRICSWRTPWS